jgi:hypothetical protein
MEGVTNAAVREVLAGYGPVGLVCSEFVRISGEKISRPYLERQVESLPACRSVFKSWATTLS